VTAPLTAVDLTAAKAVTAQRALDVLGMEATGHSLKAATEAAETIWGLLLGHLRGKVPVPVPNDLMAVATAATIRLTEAYDRHNFVSVEKLTTDVAPPLTAVGFTFTERVVIGRYRKQTT
jgi:hypothetical protein